MSDFNIVEATIDELQAGLTRGTITSVDLVARYLQRISAYDCRGVALNSVPILNTSVFDEAAASDDRRAAGEQVGLLEGVPYTVKDSYKVRGMTVASGSPAFEHLVANEDAFTVDAIKRAGGVLIGRTNMPPMAYGGMQAGIYGRAESPYNSQYLAAAFASGSSNGSGVATAASMAAFGMGEETVSSGRSPASNNGLVAYTPSRGWISIRGNWPLYVTCDVVVPHTRTMEDMLRLLEVIVVEDPVTQGDFWRDQPFVSLESPKTINSALDGVKNSTSLSGLRIAVPSMYIGGPSPKGARDVTTSSEVIELWEQARKDLEALGAEVLIVPDFPVVTAYENPELLSANSPRLPENWHWSERGPLIAHGWNNFLQQNGQAGLSSIADIDAMNIYPQSMRTPAELKTMDVYNAIRFGHLVEYIQKSTLYEVKDLKEATLAFEAMRKTLLEEWLVSIGCDCVAFPAAGDVGAADADITDSSAQHAWLNGVYYSNGNRALRHLGVPTVSVPMGVMKGKRMPVNLTFAGRANDDVNLLKYAKAYEAATRKRIEPPLTPRLPSDTVGSVGPFTGQRPDLKVEKCFAVPQADVSADSTLRVSVEGTVSLHRSAISATSDSLPVVEVTVDGVDVDQSNVGIKLLSTQSNDENAVFAFTAWHLTPAPMVRDEKSRKTLAPVARDKTMVVVLARSCKSGRPSGHLQLL